jgi:hypothetical protein|tara:strand:- start:185 stop:361 length:177 start_codon:yes stop_codon:yes gene_type:complete
MQNKSKFIKVALAIAAVAVPFGIISIGGYYAYKKYKENKENNLAKEDAELIDNEESKK